MYEKFFRVPTELVEAGDICAVCGIDDIQVASVFPRCDTYCVIFTSDKHLSPNQIGETIADKATGKPLPSIKVEEPTVRMAFSINVSPFVGREVYV